MGIATGFTAARMLEIENTTITEGFVDIHGNLLLKTREGTEFDAGHVRGSDGIQGPKGDPGEQGIPGPLFVGGIHFWPGLGRPPSFLLPLDGRSILVSEYTALAAVVPEWVYGENIVLPDWRNRFPVGAGLTHNIGDMGGSDSHDHGLTQGSARALIAATGTDLVMQKVTEAWVGNTRYAASGGSPTDTPMAYKTRLDGSTDEAETLPPFVAGTWCICVAGTIGEFDPVVQEALVNRIAPAYLPREILYFTSSDIFEKENYPWLKAIRVIAQAGGGPGGPVNSSSSGNFSVSTGGGGGGCAISMITDMSTVTSSAIITVGAGGTVTNQGGESSFSGGIEVLAKGGGAGTTKANNTLAPYQRGGWGGGYINDMIGDLLIVGTAGGVASGSDTIGCGGSGGGSYLGGGGFGGGTGTNNNSQTGSSGFGYGGGGGGSVARTGGGAVNGGPGAPGIVILELFG